MKTLLIALALFASDPALASPYNGDKAHDTKALDKCYSNLEKRLAEARALSVLSYQMMNAVAVGQRECEYWKEEFEKRHGKGSYAMPTKGATK